MLQRTCSNGQRAILSSAPCLFLSVLIWGLKVFLIFLYSACNSQLRNASACSVVHTHGGIATVIVTQNLESLYPALMALMIISATFSKFSLSSQS